ncbi:MAG: HEPN-associated N-terminal domain-containing protein [Pseudomonadota bacterium]
MQAGPTDTRFLCVECFGDDDLKRVIRRYGQKGRCAFCQSRKVAVMPVWGMADFLERILRRNYAEAVNELPYDSGEGGYQGSSVSNTWEALIEDIGLPLRGAGEEELGTALAEAIGDELWCSPNWTSLDPDESLKFSWEEFCNTVKHQRRYFFQNFGKSTHNDPDDRSPAEFLDELRELIDSENLVKEVPAGLALYRARPRKRGERFTDAADLGPPPADRALQSNRMNPPGIPMFYGADNKALALSEVRKRRASVGKFRTTRPVSLLDLSKLPRIPGFFANGSRSRRLKLAFLHDFRDDIVKPVPRDERVHVDYLPTQVFTEYLRDVEFGGVKLDGIRYPSATGTGGTNVVLFAARGDVVGVPADDHGIYTRRPTPWIKLTKVTHR